MYDDDYSEEALREQLFERRPVNETQEAAGVHGAFVHEGQWWCTLENAPTAVSISTKLGWPPETLRECFVKLSFTKSQRWYRLSTER